nr:AAA family ATPase [Brevundimonas naejangsanensis]
MSRYNPHHANAEPVFEAARRWLERCLIEDGSIFSNEEIWTADHVREVVDYFVRRPDEGEGVFFEKLKAQMEPSSPSAKRLMAELLWALSLFPSNVKPKSKRNLVCSVWRWSGSELPEDADALSDEVLGGLGSGGPGYNNHRWRELRFLINLTEAAKAMPRADRAATFNDPWIFNDWVANLPDDGNRQLKLVLPHLIHPAEFERIASIGAVRKILKSFGGVDTRRFNTMSKRERDEALLGIRSRLESEVGRQIDFYHEPLKSRWADETIPEFEIDENSGEQEAPNRPPLNQILYGPPGTGKTYTTIDRALGIVDPEFYADNIGDRASLKARFDKLVNEGAIAVVTFHQSLSYEDFVEGLKAEVDDQGRLRYLVEDGILKRMCLPTSAVDGFVPGRVFSRDYRVLRSTSEILWLRKPNGSELPLPWLLLNELAELVRSEKVSLDDIRAGDVFERVPTVRLEKYIVNGYKNILPEIVQSILASATIKPTNQASPRVLIIDEINRGNVSRIFGELITLIEPDKRLGEREQLTVTPPYSKQTFGLPNSLHLIGTMNTADRSLSAMDIALRRRFEFEEIEPNPTLLDFEVEGVEIGLLLAALNARIELLLDREHRIGHAYFTGLEGAQSLKDLANVFRHRVIPLLQEYFFDDWSRIALALNDRSKEPEDRIVVERERDAQALFPASETEIPMRPAWAVNWSALERPGAYQGILLK